MDLNISTCGIFTDLKKAFDTIVNVILLNHYGIRGIININDWFASYFLVT